jgi:phage repressor protein C with HTH and peptisase S24 domain
MKWIKERLDEIGRRPIELSRALGLPPARAYEMIKGIRRVQPDEIGRLAAFLDWPESHVVALLDGRATSKSGKRSPSTARAPIPPPARARVALASEAAREGRPDIPVWAAAQAGDDGALILVPDPVDYIFRSERMRGVRNPFAFQIVGSSMSPALEHGDQVVINPALLVRPGVDCVFIQQQRDGTFLALVKRLLRQTADNWHVRQYDPKKDFDLAKKKWSRAHVVAEIRRGGL